MTTPILLAAPGLRDEPGLVAHLGRPGTGMSVVRRCVDAADLVGAAAAGTSRLALIGPRLPRLDRATVDRLRELRVTVLGVVESADTGGEGRLRSLDVSAVVPLPPDDLDAAVAELLRAVGRAPQEPSPASVDHDPEPGGVLVACWGPAGAPGRTSVAVALADESARAGMPTLLVDADTYGPSVAGHLGLLDESSGLAVACRHADGGELDVHVLAECARGLGGPGDLRVLTGLVRAERWPDLRAAALTRVWSACRRLAGVTVVDAGSCLEADEELLADTRAPRRNAATLTALGEADLVVAVGSADPIGMERLVVGLGDVRRRTDAEIRVVVTKVRRGPLGRHAERHIREALARHAGVTDPILVPDDRASFDICLRDGRTLAEAAPRSPARAALRRAAADLLEVRLAA